MISAEALISATNPRVTRLVTAGHPGRLQAHWSLVMLEGSKIKVLRNASGYSGTLLEVGENCFQLSEVARFCAKCIFLNFAVFYFFSSGSLL